ncbi:hypothetical protein [Paenibacillus sp. J23TS9]|uniref:hypothetical protein n=1 Tax=Paenibacillus sp. J23TS9 TaxID=2807193 RepID=UPI001BCFFB91|nr:hypothetical protein [Paenibacillus sp. J23TS9]
MIPFKIEVISIYRHAGWIGLIIALAVLAGCSSKQEAKIDYGKPTNSTSMGITDEGLKWDIDKSAPSYDDTIERVSFEVKEIKSPFPPTHKAASIIKAPFDMIQLTYASLDQGRQLILVESNSQDTSEPEGKSGPKLSNGAPTWIQSDSQMSALYWRQDGLTFVLMSNQVKNKKFIPLYDEDELAIIANSIY